jgi:hypothetical protein
MFGSTRTSANLGVFHLVEQMISRQELLSILSYDSETGIFTWRTRPSNNMQAGDIAGSVVGGGYRQIRVNGRMMLAHRLAWLYVYGVNPSGEIDHIDGARENNRINNLRDVSRSENQQNRRAAQSNSKSGVIGTAKSPSGRYVAKIRVGGKKIHRGTFDTPSDAHAAYLSAKRKMHPGCTI